MFSCQIERLSIKVEVFLSHFFRLGLTSFMIAFYEFRRLVFAFALRLDVIVER